MKKTLVLVLVLALVLAASVLTLTACSGKVYEGEYSYYAWDYASWQPSTTHKYGCKVKVTIQGDVITKVVIEDDTAEFYNVSAGWTDAYGSEYGKDNQGKTNWRLYGQNMADSFVGLTTSEVLKIKVYVASDSVTSGDVIPAGQPLTTGYIETIKYLPAQVEAVVAGYGDFTVGATQSSARLVLAIQDAILKSQGKTENPSIVKFDARTTDYVGGFKYENAWVPGTYYGAMVTVTVNNGTGKIVAVKLWTNDEVKDETGETWTRTSSTWVEGAHAGDLGFNNAEAAYQSWLNSVFVGKTPYQVLAYSADTSADPMVANPKLAGATQSAARIILAVKDALKSFAN